MKGEGKALNRLWTRVPEQLTGRTKKYEKELYQVYGQLPGREVVQAMRLRNARRYGYILLGLAVITFLLLLQAVAGQQNNFSVDETGRKYIERPTYDQGSRQASLVVTGKVAGETVQKTVLLTIKPEGTDRVQEEVDEQKGATNPESLQTAALSKLNAAIYGINKGDSGKVVYLPEHIEGMKGIAWSQEQDRPLPMVVLTGGFLLLCTYWKRYDELKQLKKTCQESIERELPDFLSKLILLMNAGLVLTAAFRKIVEDHNCREGRKCSYFYSQLTEINLQVDQTNASMVGELKSFAERSRNREFMRIVNVLAENIHKGTELVKILQDENNFLWFQRKKSAEEKGRIAETKLTLPLALQLVVLIVITLAPAMLDM
ncbi:hypothetical protein Ami103574_08015 [Aminipila butyrica]|uniref:Type ii secretion system (T2ss) protein f n=1 Tax=Aminipila butyrica TaxID=433296 RepID=A0A858BTE0_9FIRM|nr:type II secretion system F family protein [Aminipila butyrica]QIB69271.1 hypothetical protein Ami103574_08015 [Aminipila butyrica]